MHRLSTAEDEPARAAFAVSRAVGSSVDRHRVTRRLRAAVLPVLSTLPNGTHLVIRALPPAAGADYRDLAAAVTDCVERSGRARAPRSGRAPVQPTDPTAVRASVGQPVEAVGVACDVPTSQTRGRLSSVVRVLGTPVRWLLLGVIGLYRLVISPILPPTCRFHPSCSAYALGAVTTHGAAKGFVLATWRVLRCNPWNLGGLDPVPRRGHWRPDVHPDGRPRPCRTLHA